jgi:hypothetical protein
VLQYIINQQASSRWNLADLTFEVRLKGSIDVRYDTTLGSLVVEALFPAFEVAEEAIDLDCIATILEMNEIGEVFRRTHQDH